MPLIEELPVKTTIRASHGWTYVPDTAAPIASTQLPSRKRARDGTTAASVSAAAHSSAHKLSAKQEKAIQQRLHDLNKENYRDAAIPIPKRDAAKSKDRKTTQNVRRILAYSRTFQHYLADEEAGVNVYGSAGNVPATSSRTGSQAVPVQQKPGSDSKRKNAANEATKGGSKRNASSRQSKMQALKADGPPDTNEADVDMKDAPPAKPASQPTSPAAPPKSPSSRSNLAQQPASPSASQQTVPTYDPALDRDPLLRTLDLPKMPSERVMQALLAEPPLSYTAARAKPLDDPAAETGNGTAFAMRTGSNTLIAKPGRWFCATCGYWGKVRCKYGCGERVCGLLECWRGHEMVCTLAATAY